MARLTKSEIITKLRTASSGASGALKQSCDTIADAMEAESPEDQILRAVRDGIDNTGLTNMERAIFVFIAGVLAIVTAPDLPAD